MEYQQRHHRIHKVRVQNDRHIEYMSWWNNNEIPQICVLLLHGMTENATIFEPFISSSMLAIEQIRKHVMIIALDRPGYGNSSDPPLDNTYSYEIFAKEIQLVLVHAYEQAHIGTTPPKLCVIGHSSGGPCAFALREIATCIWLFAPDPNYADVDASHDPISSTSLQSILHNILFEKISQLSWKDYGFISPNEYEPIDVYRRCVARNRSCAGVTTDYRLEREKWVSYSTPLSVNLKNNMCIFIGTHDPFMQPRIHAQWWIDKIASKNKELIVLPGRGHFNCLFSHEIFRDEIVPRILSLLMIIPKTMDAKM
jgi:hypothetical protein